MEVIFIDWKYIIHKVLQPLSLTAQAESLERLAQADASSPPSNHFFGGQEAIGRSQKAEE